MIDSLHLAAKPARTCTKLHIYTYHFKELIDPRVTADCVPKCLAVTIPLLVLRFDIQILQQTTMDEPEYVIESDLRHPIK